MIKKYISAIAITILLLTATKVSDSPQFISKITSGPSHECSNFSVIHGSQVFFGSNDDIAPNKIFDAEATIKIFPPTYQGAGYAEFGYWFADSLTWSRLGVVNENGFAVGTMSVPTLPLNPHPEGILQP